MMVQYCNQLLAIGDLWRVNVFSTNVKWAWWSGTPATGITPVWGTIGVSSASGTPGSRYNARMVSAQLASSGQPKLWLFGGWRNGIANGRTNDLWTIQGSSYWVVPHFVAISFIITMNVSILCCIVNMCNVLDLDGWFYSDQCRC
jgi:hypothetical protein